MEHNGISFNYYPKPFTVNSSGSPHSDIGIYISDVISSSNSNFYYWVSFDVVYETEGLTYIYIRSSNSRSDILAESWRKYEKNSFLNYLDDKFVQIMLVCLNKDVMIKSLLLREASRGNLVSFYTNYVDSPVYDSVLLVANGNVDENNVRYFLSNSDTLDPTFYQEIQNNIINPLDNFENSTGFKIKIEIIGVSEEDYGIDSVGLVVFGEKTKRLNN